MSPAQTLIDRARNGVLSQRQLAAELGEDQGFLSRIATGKAPMPPGIAARLAAAAGIDPRDAALMAVIESERDPEKQAVLAELFRLPDWRKR